MIMKFLLSSRMIDDPMHFEEALEKCFNKESGSEMITVQNLRLLSKLDEVVIYRVNAIKG